MENKAHTCLVDWIINYLNNKDLLLERIELIEKNKDGFDLYVKFREKEQFFIIAPILDNVGEIISKFDENRFFGLITFNTTNNLDILIKNWGSFIKIKHLCIFFVNPFSQSDEKWIIFPCTHNNICEKNTLARGLKSMFEMVEPLTEEQTRKFK